MDFRAWAASLLRDNTDLAYEVNVFIEKRWRDGRTPQPRGKGGRWVKHTPNLHVGLGISGGSGHGRNFFSEKLRPDDNIHVGPKRLPWKKNPNGTMTARMSPKDPNSYGIVRRDREGYPPSFEVTHFDKTTSNPLGAFPTLVEAQRAASNHVNREVEPPAPKVAPLEFGKPDAYSNKVAKTPHGDYTMFPWGNGYRLNYTKNGRYFGEEVARFDTEADALKAANEHHAAITEGRTPDEYLNFYGRARDYQARGTKGGLYKIAKDADGKYVLSGKPTQAGGIRKLGTYDSLAEAKAAAHEHVNGRTGASQSPLDIAKSLPVKPDAPEGKPVTFTRHPSGSYVGDNGYSIVKDGSKWRVFKTDAEGTREVSGAPSLKAAKEAANGHREGGSAGAADVAAKKAKAAARAAAHAKARDTAVANMSRLRELSAKKDRTAAESVERDQLMAWRDGMESLYERSRNRESLSEQERMALDTYLPQSTPTLDELADAVRNGRGNEVSKAFGRLLGGEVGKGLGTSRVRVMGDPSNMTVAADIVDANGNRVGTIERRFTRSSDGKWGVYHALMQINSRNQGKGFASTANQRLFDYYRANGLDAVTVSAALDNGGYTWATQGFQWNPAYGDGAWRNVRRQIESLLRSGTNFNGERVQFTDGEKAQLRALLEQFNAGNPPQPYDISRMVGDNPDFGRRILRGSSWAGRKPL